MIALDELKKLPIEQRCFIVEELTQSIQEDADFQESPELIAELEARYEEYLADPSSGVPWEVALERIRSKRG